MAKVKRTNPVILRRGMAIGTGNAETDDDFLFDCFVHHPAVEECTRIQSAGTILAGRTGSGKTAIIRFIETREDYATDLDPAEMSMSYVANSDALRFLNAIGADLDLLFQVLWKHVLCIEYIRLRWKVESEAKSVNVFERLVEKFNKDERKQRAINYLRDWEGKFWITMDQNIKEITEQVEKKLHAEFGAEIEKFKAGGQYDKRMSAERKSEIVIRARNIINADQLRELHGVIEMLAETARQDGVHRCFILIDKLDEKWVDESIRFKLIRSLISSLRTFRALENLKILVALRTDILERVVQETSDITFQREKFEDYFIQIIWSKRDLRGLVDRRMRVLFRRQYTGKDVEFDDVFTHNIKNKDPFDYILERTRMRPRDVISFINECFSVADGNYEVTPNLIYRAEAEYARKRRDALEQEWRSAFPTLGAMLKFITSARNVGMEWTDLIGKSELDELALNICAAGKVDFDPIFDICQSVIFDKPNARTNFLRSVLAILYRTGVIGLKIRAEDRFLYSHTDEPLISADILGEETRIRIHPMLHGAYRLSESDRSRGRSSNQA